MLSFEQQLFFQMKACKYLMTTSQNKNKQLLCLSHKFTPVFQPGEIKNNTTSVKLHSYTKSLYLIPRILSFPPIYFRKQKK